MTKLLFSGVSGDSKDYNGSRRGKFRQAEIHSDFTIKTKQTQKRPASLEEKPGIMDLG